ncbi:hypothetical protein Ga0466249_002855 [Sporomusaceae bacterium BoRhaA]|nr:hypothetical protein [Pelorhabdus rhamnosifermentans]
MPFIGTVPNLPTQNMTASAANYPASKGILGCCIRTMRPMASLLTEDLKEYNVLLLTVLSVLAKA